MTSKNQHMNPDLVKKYLSASEAYSRGWDRGVSAVLMIRCMEHRFVPQINRSGHGGQECAVCALAPIVERLRDACAEIERLEASEQQTKCITLVSLLALDVQNMILTKAQRSLMNMPEQKL